MVLWHNMGNFEKLCAGKSFAGIHILGIFFLLRTLPDEKWLQFRKADELLATTAEINELFIMSQVAVMKKWWCASTGKAFWCWKLHLGRFWAFSQALWVGASEWAHFSLGMACPMQCEHMLTSALACGQSPGASCKVCSKKLIQASAGEKVSSDWCVCLIRKQLKMRIILLSLDIICCVLHGIIWKVLAFWWSC